MHYLINTSKGRLIREFNHPNHVKKYVDTLLNDGVGIISRRKLSDKPFRAEVNFKIHIPKEKVYKRITKDFDNEVHFERWLAVLEPKGYKLITIKRTELCGKRQQQ